MQSLPSIPEDSQPKWVYPALLGLITLRQLRAPLVLRVSFQVNGAMFVGIC